MFGLSWLHQIFLAGIAAAALPILIHLFSRRRAREVPFPSLEYLREISRQKVRRMRLRQWLLLALRVAIVALFAMAMGRPVLRGSGGVATRGSSTVVILLDNSYSMAAADPALTGNVPSAPADAEAAGAQSVPGGVPAAPGVPEQGTLFRAAKNRALEVLDLMNEGDRGMLVLTGRPVGLPFQSPVADAGLLRQEVKRAALSADVSDLPAALEAVLPQLASSRTTNKEIFVISDFQRKDVDGWIRGGDAAGTRPERAGGDSTGTIAALPKGVKVYLIPVTEKAQPNASIERLRYDSASGIGGGGRVTATVVNQGDDPVTDRVIRLTAASGGPSLADALVSIPPHGSEEVRMDLPAAPPEGGGLCVRLGSDPLEWDNEAWLVTGEPGVRKVLVVSGPETPATPSESRIAEAEQPAGSGSGPAGGSAGTTAGGTAGAEAAASGAAAATDRTPGARFIRLALDPGGNAEFYQVREADPGALNDPSALDADVVILSDVGRLSDAAVENLVRFRARGGGILIGLGDHVDPRSYNTSILGKLTSIELLNISQDEGAGAFRSLRPTVAAHPIFSGFPIGPGDDLSSARFRKVMTSRVGQGARVIAEFGRDVPAVIEDEGVLVFTSSLDGEWTDFVTSASYPPLLHQMVRYLIGRGGGERSGKVGARLETLLPETAVQGSVTMAGPDGGTEPVEAVPVERTIRLRSQPATQPGIYKFVDGSGRTVAAFAVNLDAREGDLALAAPQAENRLFGRESRRLEPGEKVNRELLEGRSGRELWRPLLVVVLLLLVVESVLGRGRILG